MDTAAVVHRLYQFCREKRLADLVALLSDDFQMVTVAPEDDEENARRRSRAELALLSHRFFEEFDILTFEPGSIDVDGHVASTRAAAVFRHKKSGDIVDTTFVHQWRLLDGKVRELTQECPPDDMRALRRGMDGA